MIRITTNDLISDVRSLLDESTETAIEDTADILAALNRAQAEAVTIICSQYDDLLVVSKDYTIADVTGFSVPMPEDILEDRVQKIDFKASSSTDWVELKPTSYREAGALESTINGFSVYAPQNRYYYTQGKRVYLVPYQTFTSLRVWYSKEPDRMVKPLGTITAVSSGAIPYVHIEDSSVDFVSSASSTDSYVNLVDGETGVVKATLQIASKIADKITFRTSPQRSSILGRTVSSALPVSSSANPDQEVKPDDYICSATGSCVPFLKGVYVNFLIQSAVLDLKRKLGDAETIPVELQLKENFLKYVKSLWTGRQQGLRVKLNNINWSVSTRKGWRR